MKFWSVNNCTHLVFHAVAGFMYHLASLPLAQVALPLTRSYSLLEHLSCTIPSPSVASCLPPLDVPLTWYPAHHHHQRYHRYNTTAASSMFSHVGWPHLPPFPLVPPSVSGAVVVPLVLYSCPRCHVRVDPRLLSVRLRTHQVAGLTNSNIIFFGRGCLLYIS